MARTHTPTVSIFEGKHVGQLTDSCQVKKSHSSGLSGASSEKRSDGLWGNSGERTQHPADEAELSQHKS